MKILYFGFLYKLIFDNASLINIISIQNVTVVRMDRTAVTCVDPVSTTHSVTMSTVAVYRGVVLGTREISVQKVTEMKEKLGHLTKFLENASKRIYMLLKDDNFIEYRNFLYDFL